MLSHLGANCFPLYPKKSMSGLVLRWLDNGCLYLIDYITHIYCTSVLHNLSTFVDYMVIFFRKCWALAFWLEFLENGSPNNLMDVL